MVVYICDRCMKPFNQKSHFLDHQNRKYPCVQHDNEKYEKIHQKYIKIHQNLVESTPKSPEIPKKYICNFCCYSFCRSDVLKKHLTRCKIRKEENKDKEDLLQLLIQKDEEIKKQSDKLKKQSNEIKILNKKLNEKLNVCDIRWKPIHLDVPLDMPLDVKHIKKTNINLHNNNTNVSNTNVSNSNNISNSNNNISNSNNNITNIRIEFGKEDLSKIDNNVFMNSLLKASGAEIPSKLIEGIHFNESHREYQNVYISDASRNKALVHNGIKWNVANADEVVDNLFDKSIIYAENKKEELEEVIEMKPKIVKTKINKEMKLINLMKGEGEYDINNDGMPIDEDGKIIDDKTKKRGERLNARAKEKIKLVLYNKKDLRDK